MSNQYGPSAKDEGRNDYTDVHGSHSQVPAGAPQNFARQVNSAASMLESIDAAAPKKEFLSKLACTIIRSLVLCSVIPHPVIIAGMVLAIIAIFLLAE